MVVHEINKKIFLCISVKYGGTHKQMKADKKNGFKQKFAVGNHKVPLPTYICGTARRPLV